MDKAVTVAQKAGLPTKLDELPAEATLMQILAAAAVDERVQPEKFRALLAIKREIEQDERVKIYNENFSLMQEELPVIPKDAQIEVKGHVRSKYARYESIAKAIRPVLKKYGFSTGFNTQIEGRTIKVWVTIKHKAGHSEKSEVALPLDESEYRSAVQNYGATISFCKRYALCDALDIITEGQDTDATIYSLINEDQRKAIEGLIEICKMNEEGRSKFLAWAGAKTVSDILQKDYPEVINQLMKKRKQIQERAAKK